MSAWTAPLPKVELGTCLAAICGRGQTPRPLRGFILPARWFVNENSIDKSYKFEVHSIINPVIGRLILEISTLDPHRGQHLSARSAADGPAETKRTGNETRMS